MSDRKLPVSALRKKFCKHLSRKVAGRRAGDKFYFEQNQISITFNFYTKTKNCEKIFNIRARGIRGDPVPVHLMQQNSII
jgi:hypothetical protein